MRGLLRRRRDRSPARTRATRSSSCSTARRSTPRAAVSSATPGASRSTTAPSSRSSTSRRRSPGSSCTAARVLSGEVSVGRPAPTPRSTSSGAWRSRAPTPRPTWSTRRSARRWARPRRRWARRTPRAGCASTSRTPPRSRRRCWPTSRRGSTRCCSTTSTCTAEIMSHDAGARDRGDGAVRREVRRPRPRRLASATGRASSAAAPTRDRTGQLGVVKLLGESSIGAGVRRVEALVGIDAYRFLAREHHLVAQLTEALKVRPEELPERVDGDPRPAQGRRARDRQAALRPGRCESAGALAAGAEGRRGVAVARGCRCPTARPPTTCARWRSTSAAGWARDRPAAVALAAVPDDKPIVVVAVNDAARTRGRQGWSPASGSRPQALGGGGGGKDDVAQGGGTRPVGRTRGARSGRGGRRGCRLTRGDAAQGVRLGIDVGQRAGRRGPQRPRRPAGDPAGDRPARGTATSTGSPPWSPRYEARRGRRRAAREPVRGRGGGRGAGAGVRRGPVAARLAPRRCGWSTSASRPSSATRDLRAAGVSGEGGPRCRGPGRGCHHSAGRARRRTHDRPSPG